MTTNNCWQLEIPFEAIVFDCDGTLSSIEGIDVLAEKNHVGDMVKRLTADAMGHLGMNPEIYRERLNLVNPTKHQVYALGERYFEHLEPDCLAVIRLLQRCHKRIFIVSAGLKMAIDRLGQHLNIPTQQIYAVELSFDLSGNYLDFDTTSPLIKSAGKQEIIKLITNQFKRVAYIGDGLNDVMVKDFVDRFIGYGGAFYRENIAAMCEYYVKSKSMLPLLPLLLTQQEIAQFNAEDVSLYHRGLYVVEHQSSLIINTPPNNSQTLLIG